jgi:hypothetical protein
MIDFLISLFSFSFHSEHTTPVSNSSTVAVLD